MTTTNSITSPETVVVAHLHWPLQMPDGFKLYVIETEQERYFATEAPLLRDVQGQRLTLDEELGPGSVVRCAVDRRGLIYAVQVVQQAYADPFAVVATA